MAPYGVLAAAVRAAVAQRQVQAGARECRLLSARCLILDTAQCLVIITGCAHQGITNVLTKAKAIMGKDIYLVPGGFHLLNMTEARMRGIIVEFQRKGVRKCSASHCTGDLAIRLLQEAYGQGYEPMGTGRFIQIQAATNNAGYHSSF